MKLRLLILCLFLFISTVTVQAEPAKQSHFSNPTIGVEFTAPEGFLLVDDPKSVAQVREDIANDHGSTVRNLMKSSRVGLHFMAICLDEPTASLNLSTEEVPTRMTVEQYLGLAKKLVPRAYPNAKFGEDGNCSIGGETLPYLQYRFAPRQEELFTVRTAVRLDSSKSLIQLMTLGCPTSKFEKMLPTLESALQGFSFSQSGTGIQDTLDKILPIACQAVWP